MEFLNTYGGEVTRDIGSAILFGVFAVFFVFLIFYCLSEDYFGIALLCLVVSIISMLMVSTALEPDTKPVRHEVILREGYVIDATEYDIIEQRGSIYVIEERKPSDK